MTYGSETQNQEKNGRKNDKWEVNTATIGRTMFHIRDMQAYLISGFI